MCGEGNRARDGYARSRSVHFYSKKFFSLNFSFDLQDGGDGDWGSRWGGALSSATELAVKSLSLRGQQTHG